MYDRVTKLIEFLQNETAPIDERDDVAMELADYADPRIIDPLAFIALDPDVEYWFAQTCAESLAEVWVKLGYFDKEIVRRLPENVVGEVLGIFSVRKPEWHKELIEYLNTGEVDDPIDK